MPRRFNAVSFLTIGVPLVVIGLMVAAGFAWHRISALSLPISGVLILLTTLLPFASLLTVQQLRAGSLGRYIGDGAYITSFLLLLFNTILITLTATHLLPSELQCQLNTTWQSYFHNKAPAIQHIQDALNCCGYRSHLDMFYPFEHGSHEKGHKASCLESYPTREGRICAPLWEAEQKRNAGILLGVAVTAAAMKVLAMLLARYGMGQAAQRGEERRRIVIVDDESENEGGYRDEEEVRARRNVGFIHGAGGATNGGGEETQRLLRPGEVDGQPRDGPAFGAMQPSLLGGSNEGRW